MLRDPCKARISRLWRVRIGRASQVLLLAILPALATPSTAQEPIPRDTLFLVGDARLGPGLTHPWNDLIGGSASVWRRAMAFPEWTPGAVIAGAGAANYAALERHAPLLADSVRRLVRTGAWEAVGGWWSGTGTSWLHGESLVRQGLYGQEFLEERFGARARVAWFPGSDFLPPTLPQLLAGVDLEFLVASRHSASSPAAGLRGAFEWIGNDGTRLLGYAPYDYGDFADFEFEFPGPIPDGSDGRSRIALYGVRDAGWEPTTTESIRRVPSAGERPSVVRFASPSAAFLSLRASASGNPPPEYRGALLTSSLPQAIGGGRRAGSRPALDSEFTHRIAHIETELRTAEALATVASGLPGGLPYPRKALRGAWRQLLGAVSFVAAASDREAKPGGTSSSVAAAGLDSAAATLDSLIDRTFTVIRRQMDTRATPSGAYVLFNPLGHRRSGATYVEIGSRGTTVRSARAADSRELLLVNLPDVPAFGAVSVAPGPDGLPGVIASGLQPPAAGDLWMENSFLRIEIDPASGAIARILDKTNGRQALPPAGRANVLRVRSKSGTSEEVTRILSLSSSVTARAATITLQRGWGESAVRQQLVLARSANFLEVRTEVVRLEAGVGVELRVELEGTPTTTSIQAPYGAMDWPVELASPLAGRWVSAADGGYGLTVIADRATAWNRSIEGIGAVLFGPAADEPTARTDGDSRLAIYPHAGNWLEAGVPHLADGFATPLLSELEPPHGGRLGERFSFFSSDHPTVSMEWMKRARKGDGVVLRLVNRGSAPARAVVESACPRVSARRANLLEDPGDPISGSRSGFPVQFRSHEIATVVVDCEP